VCNSGVKCLAVSVLTNGVFILPDFHVLVYSAQLLIPLVCTQFMISRSLTMSSNTSTVRHTIYKIHKFLYVSAPRELITKMYKLTCQYIIFEVPAATEFKEIFSGRQMRKDVKIFPTFRELTPSPNCPSPRCMYTAQGRTTRHQFWFYQATDTP